MPNKFIVNWMLQEPMREYVIDKIKRPLLKAIIILAQRYPKPDHENCVQSGSHILIDLRDKFLKYEDNFMRAPLFESLWRIVIDEYEHDRYYRHRMDFIIDELIKSKWQREKGTPRTHWKEFEGGNQC